MSEPNYAKLFHEATGGCWHDVFSYEGYIDYPSNTGGRTKRRRYVWYKCRKCEVKTGDKRNLANPTYTNPADILKLMRDYCGEERYKIFINSFTSYTDYRHWTTYKPTIDFINEYILNAPALLQKCVEFLEGE